MLLRNEVKLAGKIKKDFIRTGNCYESEIEIKRVNSDKFDRIKIIVLPRQFGDTVDAMVKSGDFVECSGELAKIPSTQLGKKIDIVVEVVNLKIINKERYENSVEITGEVVSVNELINAVNGGKYCQFRVDVWGSDFDCVSWNRIARYAAFRLQPGFFVEVAGRIQSRTYNKIYEGKEHTYYSQDINVFRLNNLNDVR